MSGWWAASYIALWALVAALLIVVVALARQVGVLHLRLGPRGALEMDDEGPPLGEAPPTFTATDDRGDERTIGGPGEGQFLLFVSPSCPVCRHVLPSLPVVARVGGMAPFAISDGPGAPHADGRVPLILAPELARTYAVPGTPYAVVLDAEGIVRAKGTVNNLEQLEGLAETARSRLAPVRRS